MFLKPTIYKTSLNALHYSGMARLLEHVCAGVGSLLTLHHVRPRNNPKTFSPNRGLEITPEFFEEVIREVRKLGCEFVSLDEFQRRMQSGEFERRLVSFTLDDGYEDNYVHAYPVFKQYEIPFAIYVCTGILDGSAALWWRDLEEIIRQSDEVRFPVRGTMETLATQGLRQKYRAFDAIYWAFRALTHEQQLEIWETIS